VNEVKYANHWIAFKTIGTKSNRDGIGARIRVTAGKRLFVDEVRSGSSYNSSSDLRMHFGLGSATTVDSVEVRWPNGDVEKFFAKVDQFNTLKEGEGQKAAADKH
jgi:enediyne biosynthesis protein E4